MRDADLREKTPQSIRAYLSETRETMRTCRDVWKLIATKESRVWARRMIFFMLCAALFKTAQPFVIGLLMNILAEQRPDAWQSALGVFGIFLALLACKDTAQYIHSRCREYIFGCHEATFLHNVSRHLFEKSMGQHAQEGSVLNIANIDKGRSKILELQNITLFTGIQLVIELTLSFIFLFIISPVAGGIAFATLVLYLAWSLFLNYKTAEICTGIEREFRRINRHRVERWDLIERTKTNGKEQEELETLSAWQNANLVHDRAFWFWFIRQGMLRGIVNTLGLAVTFAYGSYRVFQGSWEVGTLVPLFLWHLRIYENIWQIGFIEHQFNSMMPPARSLTQAVLLPPAFTPEENAPHFDPSKPVSVHFEDVSYAYPTNDRTGEATSAFPAVRNISFDIRPGEKVALVGTSGSGKTTLMRLLLRHMDPDRGNVSVNGTPLCGIHLPSWLRAVGYIAQQPQIFDATMRYNLIYGLSPEERRRVTDEELRKIMRLLQVDFGERLTHGLDTRVGRHGMKLSGGQAQRLMVAAAVIKRPSFMVIDEATSNLDSITEREVQHGLSITLAGNMGALIVAHRLSTIRHLCNRFIVLRTLDTLEKEEHQIEAIGDSFEELYAVSPTFRQLADAQEVAVR